MDWSKVTRIRGVKLDLITYEENFLMLEMGDAAHSFGELDVRFSALVQEVLRRFPDISADWRAPLEEAAGPRDMILWERE